MLVLPSFMTFTQCNLSAVVKHGMQSAPEHHATTTISNIDFNTGKNVTNLI